MRFLGLILTTLITPSAFADEILHCGPIYPESVQIVQGIEFFNGTWNKGPALSVMYADVKPFLLKSNGTVIQLSDDVMQKAGPYYYKIPAYDDTRQAALWGEIQNAAIWPLVCLSEYQFEVSYRMGNDLKEAIRATPVTP